MRNEGGTEGLKKECGRRETKNERTEKEIQEEKQER